MRRGGAARLPLLIVALAIGLFVSRKTPSDHTIRVVLGDVAPRVVETRLRYAEASASGHSEEWQREVTFLYAAGNAPRIVSHQPRLADGDYDLEIELGVISGAALHTRQTVTVSRRIHLDATTAQVDVASAVRDSLGETGKAP